MKKLFLLSIALFLFLPLFARADEPAAPKSIPIYIFTQQGCPHCSAVLSLLEELKQTYPGIEIHEFDMKIHPEYVQSYARMTQAYGISPNYVPLTFIGAKAIEGANESTIKEAAEYCSLPVNQCIDPGKYIQNIAPLENNTAGNAKQKIIGWAVISVILAGGATLLIYKLR